MVEDRSIRNVFEAKEHATSRSETQRLRTGGVQREQLLNSFRTAVPFWGQTTQSSNSLPPKRDCGSKGVKGAPKERNSYLKAKATGAMSLNYSKHITKEAGDRRRKNECQSGGKRRTHKQITGAVDWDPREYERKLFTEPGLQLRNAQNAPVITIQKHLYHVGAIPCLVVAKKVLTR